MSGPGVKYGEFVIDVARCNHDFGRVLAGEGHPPKDVRHDLRCNLHRGTPQKHRTKPDKNT
jgi:hypothetical protein